MYYIVYVLLWLLSILPFWLLYFISDAIYGLVFYVFKYRREVVFKNLAIAFPEKTETERYKIAKQFYHNLIDTFIETIKFITISKKEILKRSSADFTIINELLSKGHNVNIMAGHQFNWEYGNLQCALHLSVPFIGIYMPISNKHLDKIFYKFREQFGTVLIPATEYKKNVFHPAFSKQHTVGLAADQNPGDPYNAYWMRFFSQPAPFVTGPGRGAAKKNTAMVMVTMKKIKRGYYRFTAALLEEFPARYTPEELTLRYKNALEQIILADPANYLWSHRRWKFEWKPEYGDILD
jgi:Kdo2-lipid IVA lauroyltransferase/acyltransferase